MKYITCEVPDNVAYNKPIEDIHLGDKSFKGEGETKLKGYLDWVKLHPNARIFLNGDIFNVAGRNSKTSPFETDTNEYQQAIDLFKPYKDQIIGATDGNHEARMMDEFGVSPLALMCGNLGIPYCKYMGIVELRVGKRMDKGAGNRYHQIYWLCFHHTTGGGSTIGSKINRVTKLSDIVWDMDVYFGNHNHQLAVAPQEVYYPSKQTGEMLRRRIWYVDCGSFLGWENGYAEKGMMIPTKLGSPRVRFSGLRDDHSVNISL